RSASAGSRRSASMDGHRLQTPLSNRSLSLIIPAYHEAAGIRAALHEADEALTELVGDYEILVVDDGVNDDAADIVTALTRQLPGVRLLRHPMNQGYGAALRTGLQAARCERVAFTDADRQFYLRDLAGLVERTEQVSVAVGYRVDRQDPWHRRFFSW